MGTVRNVHDARAVLKGARDFEDQARDGTHEEQIARLLVDICKVVESVAKSVSELEDEIQRVRKVK